jgi:hypothetical protein
MSYLPVQHGYSPETISLTRQTFSLSGLICFGLAMAYIPFIVIKARKFSLLFSLGSLFTVFRSV